MMPYSSLVFSRSVQTRQWWTSLSPSYTPRTVCVLPTSTTRSIPPSPLEIHDLAARKPLGGRRPLAPEDQEAGVVDPHGGPRHVVAVDAEDDALPVQERAAPPFRQDAAEPRAEEEPVRVREAFEEAREDLHPREGAARLDLQRRRLPPQGGGKVPRVGVDVQPHPDHHVAQPVRVGGHLRQDP